MLLSLDKTDAQQAFEKAQTALATSVRQTRQLMLNGKQYQATIKLQQTALDQAESNLKRREPLGASNLIGREELQHARDAVATATNLWVDVNFKETQLAGVRIGQPATVISDIYGDDIEYQGKVVGLDMGTSSAFSLLPTQNATANWIKVVQRLPVRIELEPKEVAQHPLLIGLSTLVKVDTQNKKDGAVLASSLRAQAARV